MWEKIKVVFNGLEGVKWGRVGGLFSVFFGRVNEIRNFMSVNNVWSVVWGGWGCLCLEICFVFYLKLIIEGNRRKFFWRLFYIDIGGREGDLYIKIFININEK